MITGAVLSPCKRFRHRLWRIWDEAGPRLVVIMLNPSTADESTNDPTILWLIAFARLHGFGGIEVLNLYDYRTPSPLELKRQRFPYSLTNVTRSLVQLADTIVSMHGGKVVCAWGANAQPNRALDLRIDLMLEDLTAYRFDAPLTKNGQPRHPLYLKRDTQLVEWEALA
jgi:hypothetical protein